MGINPYKQMTDARRKASAIDPLDYYRNAAQQVETTPEDANSAGIVERIWHTGEGTVKSLTRGAIDSVEGVVDLGIGLIGGVGGMFSPKFRQLMKEAVEYDAVQEWIYDPLDDVVEDIRGSRIGEYSYIKEGSIPDMVIEGVGGMLPAVAISIATAGTGAPAAVGGTVAKVGGIAGKVGLTATQAAKVAQVASMATMAAGAAGQATEEAYRDGAGYYGGLGYGITRGAIEAGTEYALGGFTKGLTGGGKLLPGVRKSVAATGAKRVIKNAVEEGLEEMISEASDPATRTIYQGPEALKKYLDPETYKQIGQAGIVGTATGGVFQGTIGHALGNSGKAADVREIMSEVETLETKRRNLHTNDKLTADADASIGSDIRENYRVMETVLKKATPEKRAALIENFGLSKQFGEDGSMKADFAASLDRKATAGQMATDTENGAPAGSVTNGAALDRRTASVDAEAEQVAKVLAKEGRTQFTDVENLSKDGQKNLRDLKRVMNVFSDVTGGAVGNFVIANESVADNAYYDGETGYIVIGADALEKGHSVAGTAQQSWFETTIHEALHGVEGTETFVKLVHQMGKVTFRPALLEKLNSRGYIGESGDTWQQIDDRIRELTEKDPATMTAEELKELADFKSEYAALMAEEVLGTRHFARRLLSADAGLFERILGGVQDVIAKLAKIKDPEAAEVAAEFEKAEKMFLDALAEKGMQFVEGKIIGADEEDEVKKSNKKQSSEKSVREAVDNEGGQEYNRKAITPYADVMAVTKESYEHRDWATNPVRSVLFFQETMRFYQQIERMEEGRYSPPKTGDGYYLVEVNPYKNSTNTKIVVTDGDTANPSIEAVIDLMTGNAFTTQKVREYIERNTTAQKVEQLPIRIENAFPYEKNVTVWVSTCESGLTFDGFESKRNGFAQHQTKYVYTQEQYERFGWAVSAGLLEPGHIDDLETKKFGVGISKKYFETYKGEHVIPVNSSPKTGHGVNRAFLFVTGDTNNWKINRVVWVNFDSETQIERVEKQIYKLERIAPNESIDIIRNMFGDESVAGYDSVDFNDYQIYSALVGRGSSRSASGGDHAGSHQRQTAKGNRGQAVGDLPQTGVKKSRKANSQTSGKASADPSEVSHLTAMQKQTVANYARTKVYTKAEALKVVEDMAHFLDENYGFDGGMGEASGFVTLTKTVKDGAARQLWAAYNSAKTDPERRKIAGELADQLMTEAKLVTLASDEELAEARAVADCLRRYFGKINLSGIEGEIKSSGLDAKALRGRWGAKKGETSFTADQLKGEIEDKLGRSIPADNAADIFFWMDEQYRKASEVIGNTNKALLFGDGNGASLAENRAIRDQIAAEIFKSFKEGGKPSEWTKRLLYEVEPFYDQETEGAGITRAVFNAGKALNFARLNVRVAALSADVKDWKAGVFLNQSQPQHQSIFKDTIGQLSKVNRGGRLLDPIKTRELIGKLGEWYTEETMKAMGLEVNPEIDEYIKQISKGEGGLTVSDMHALKSVIEYMKHTAENYQTVWRNGKRVKALPVAREYAKIMKENQALRKGSVDAVFSSWYLRLYGDPHMLVRYMDKYKQGFYTEMFERMREGAMKAQIYRKRMEDQIRTTMKDYPKYFKELEKRKIKLHGAEMPAAEAMSLYMSLFRDQAVAGILENGYCFTDDVKKETVRRVFGFTGDEVIRDKDGNIKLEYKQKIEGLQTEIWGQLNEADRKYINVVWKLLNDDCKTLKRDTDLARMGYSNAIEDFYYPIRRANSAQDIDRQTFFDEVSRISNASFNKDTVKGAKNQLLIEPIDVVVGRHIRGVTMYGALATVIDDYKMLKNLNVDESQNHNKPISIATEEQNTWAQGRQYFEQLMSDIQGIRGNTDEVTKVIGKIRGNYARFALAANPKVVMTQLSSIFAGMNIIDADCMLKGFSDRGRDVFTYSELAELRASENTAAMAQGLIDEAGDILMKPIGWMDSYVVRRLWVAAQHQVAKDQKLKVGTEENKKAAGKLLEKVIFETQQNSLATEKSQAARSSSEFQKMVTMFTSDAVKGMGQLLDAFGEISVIRREAKINGIAVDSVRLKAAEKRFGRAAASLAAVAIYTAILSQLFRKLLKKEDEEEPWSGFMADTMGAMLGGLPLISDAYEYFFGSGYGLEDMSIAAVNDLLEGIKSLFGTAGAFVTGDLDERDLHKDLRQMLFALGQVTGLPTRNLYNYARAAVHWVSPETGYKMDDSMSVQPYRSDIAKAIEAEDEGRLETVIGVMLDENVGEVTSSAVRQEMNRLVSNGMDVLPRGVGDTVTVDGEAVKLTAKQQKAFKAVYAEANKSVEKMVGLAYYTNASDEAKAKAIKRVYGIYYNRAIEDLLGVELENKNTLLSHAIDPEVLAVVLAICGEIEADKDANGKAISGSKRRKIEDFVESLKLKAAQKYIIMGALGYKNKLGEAKVQAYVNGLGLSKNEREALMGYSGY